MPKGRLITKTNIVDSLIMVDDHGLLIMDDLSQCDCFDTDALLTHGND